MRRSMVCQEHRDEVDNWVGPLNSTGIDMESDCRHVVNGEHGFAKRMRFHQSWYRRYVLNLPPGPNASSRPRNSIDGNILRKEDGRAGHNFLSCEIHSLAEARIRENDGLVEKLRLRRNLLSSQPMCFNLFGPLAQDLSLAKKLLDALPDGPGDVAVVTDVRIEYAPPSQHHLHDRTAFDAWIAYQRKDGGRGFVGVETKLTEPFSAKEYSFDERYSRWSSVPGWWWKPGAERQFSSIRTNQLWRNHLLAFSMLHQAKPMYNEAYCAVVYHPLDTKCERAIAAYRDLLVPAGQPTLLEWRLDELIERWNRTVIDVAGRSWLDAFQQRYLNLELSRSAWSAFGTRSR